MLPSFRLFGEIIYLYPMLAGLAWGVGFFMSQRISKESEKSLNLLLISFFVSSWLGAKLFFLLTSSHINHEEFIKSSNFWLGGGFVFYGGLIFGLLTLWIFLKITQQRLREFAFLVVPLGVGHGIGRVGCFFAGCCHGVHYPVQLFEAGGLFLISMICFKRLKQNKEIFSFYLKNYSVLRFTLEFMRGDEIRGLYIGLSTSQWISLFIIFVLLLRDKTKPNALILND